MAALPRRSLTTGHHLHELHLHRHKLLHLLGHLDLSLVSGSHHHRVHHTHWAHRTHWSSWANPVIHAASHGWRSLHSVEAIGWWRPVCPLSIRAASPHSSRSLFRGD